jgi:hypothetical protein
MLPVDDEDKSSDESGEFYANIDGARTKEKN